MEADGDNGAKAISRQLRLPSDVQQRFVLFECECECVEFVFVFCFGTCTPQIVRVLLHPVMSLLLDPSSVRMVVNGLVIMLLPVIGLVLVLVLVLVIVLVFVLVLVFRWALLADVKSEIGEEGRCKRS